jgi:hypothetical protein
MALGDYMGVQCHACIGGTSVREDIRKLDDGVHVVVGESNILFLGICEFSDYQFFKNHSAFFKILIT